MSRITIIGDSLWDVELRGESTRLAPDVPVPVVENIHKTERPGGAALAATLAARDGHDVALITWLGEDDYAVALRKFLISEGVEVIGVPLISGSTPVKIRVGTTHHTLLRMDLGCEEQQGAAVRVGGINVHISRSDVVLVSDYGRGITSDPTLRLTLRSADVPVLWDPHPKGAFPVSGTAIVTPNRAEAAMHSGCVDPAQQAQDLRERWSVQCVAVTAGPHGVYASTERQTVHIPTTQLIGMDACGAGDRFATALCEAVLTEPDLVSALEAATRRATDFVAAGAATALTAPGLAISMVPNVV